MSRTREEYLALLGLSSGASWEDVCEAYYDLHHTWDPDHYQDCAEKQKAATKQAELTQAYDFLRAERTLGPSSGDGRNGGEKHRSISRTPVSHDRRPPPLPAIVPLLCLCCAAFAALALTIYILSQARLTALQNRITELETSLGTAHIEHELLAGLNTCPQRPGKAAGSADPAPLPGAEEQNGASPPEAEAMSDLEQPADIEIGPLAPAFKEKDKLYVLAKNRPPAEHIINYTPDIVEAAVDCDLPWLRDLVKQGADVDTADDRGDTPLMWAVRRRCLAAAEFLVQHGASVNVRSSSGFTPYVWARIYRDRRLQTLLERAGADTETGRYWWRDDTDTKGAWLDQALKYACANKKCD